jgi:CrcB protein
LSRYLAVMLGGAFGSVVRYAIGLAIVGHYHGRFPISTLLINVTGSFLIGLTLTVIPFDAYPVLRPFLVTGVLGGYTTFSAFEWETLVSPRAIAVSYVVLSIGGGLAACWLGAAIGRYVSR